MRWQPRNPPQPGLHPQQREQQDEAGDSAPLPCSGETPLQCCLQLWGTNSRRTRSCWSGARGGPGDAGRAGAPLLGGQAERAGGVQPGEEKAPGRPSSPCQALKGLQESWGGTLEQGGEPWDEGEGFYTDRGEIEMRREAEIVGCEGGEPLAQVAQRSCGCPIPGGVQGQVGRGLEQPGLVGGVPAQGRGWHWVAFKALSNPNPSVIL